MNKAMLNEKILLPDGGEIPVWVYLAAFLSAPAVLFIVAMFMLPVSLWPGLFLAVAFTAGIVWLGSRGTEWMN